MGKVGKAVKKEPCDFRIRSKDNEWKDGGLITVWKGKMLELMNEKLQKWGLLCKIIDSRFIALQVKVRVHIKVNTNLKKTGEKCLFKSDLSGFLSVLLQNSSLCHLKPVLFDEVIERYFCVVLLRV